MTQNERKSIPIWKRMILFTLSIIVFALQLILLYFVLDVTTFEYQVSLTARIIYYVMEAIGFGFVIYLNHQPINTSYKLTWCILILILPIPFISLYLLNRQARSLSKRKRKKIAAAFGPRNISDGKQDLWDKDPMGASLVSVVQKSSSYAPVYDNSRFTFFSDIADKFEDLKKELENAKKFIYIETFILADGNLMEELLPLLEKKGNDGVEIKIIYDDIGSRGVLHKKTIKRILSIPNCQFVNYEPLGFNINLTLNYRDHRKIFIIDGIIAYCGGDNLADEYIHKKERFGYWRDNCGKYEGEIVKSFVVLFYETWFLSTKEKIPDYTYSKEYDFVPNGFTMVFGDGPTNDSNPSYDLFLSLINSATKSLLISTPYFIIDDAVIELISLKAKSGVDVKILAPRIPDKKTVFYMTRSRYKKIVKSGGKVYEYLPGFNHAKNIIVDDKYAFIGTVNMDFRSLFLHYECGALILHSPEIINMRKDFDDAISVSEEMDMKKIKARPWYQKFFAVILNVFAPLF